MNIALKKWKLTKTRLQRTSWSIFPGQFETLVWNHHTKFKKKRIPRKDTMFESVCVKVFNNLPNDVRSARSFLTFKSKSF